jgi:purine nucleosidase
MATKKVILDIDPGSDDALALAIALFDPAIEVVAVTAVGGAVLPEQATRNVQAVIEQLDPPRWPRIGVASLADDGLPANMTSLFGADGLGNAQFSVAELHQRHLSEKVICDEAKVAPEEITLVALGPLTNVDRALKREPNLNIGQIVMMGGTLHGPGNITPAAEYNIFCDPAAARAVFRSATTKTLVPLDVTSQVVFNYDFLNNLPDENSRAGRFLRRIMPFTFRAYRQTQGLEGIYLNDTVALMAALHPELFEIEMTAVDVEMSGELTTGATVFDRRRVREWRTNLAVAVGIDVAAVTDCILRGIHAAAVATRDA